MTVASADTSNQKPTGNPSEGSKTNGKPHRYRLRPGQVVEGYKKCKKIVHVQFMKYFADGKEIKPGEL